MKLNLVIDISGLFYRSLFTVGNFGSKGKLLSTEQSQGIFMRKLATDISSFIKSVDNLNRVIFTVDSNSWRKKVFIEEGGYKSTRIKTDTVDWDAFFILCDKLVERLRKRGYTVLKQDNAEADDLLYLTSRKLNTEGECVILGTGDKDMHQTAQLLNNGAWTIILDPVNGRRKVTFTEEIKNLLSTKKDPKDFDIFGDGTLDSIDLLKNIVVKETINIIDVNRAAIEKVITGDKGDAVPSVITWKKKEKENAKAPQELGRITPTQYNKAIEGHEYITWQNLRDGKDLGNLLSALRTVTKQETADNIILERLKRNVILTILDEETIPKEIQIEFNNTLFEGTAIYSSRDQILEDSEYIKTNIVPKSYDLF